MKTIFFAISLLLLSALLMSAEQKSEQNQNRFPPTITLAHENQNAYPWVYQDAKGNMTGLDLELLQMVAKEMGISIRFIPYPWIRALTQMQLGEIDGVFAASFDPERQQYGHYPMRGNKPDRRNRIHTSGYSLYTLKSSPLTFDQNGFHHLNGSIGVQREFSIADDLASYRVSLSQTTNDPQRLLEQLLRGRIAAVALQTERADQLIAQDPTLIQQIKKSPTLLPPFHHKPYFVMFSEKMVSQYPEFTQQFWNTLQRLRNSETYQTRLKKRLAEQN